MFSTADYIDSQTQSITLLVNTFSAEYGIASTISITAWFGPTVQVIWTVQHLQATEGEQLLAYESIISIGLALAGVILVERVYSMETTLRHRRLFERNHPDLPQKIETEQRKWKALCPDLPAFVVDLCILVFLPITYFATRYLQLKNSRKMMSETVGLDGGLMSVPWASKDDSIENKMLRYLDSIQRVDAQHILEYYMRIFYFVHVILCLMRLLTQTKVHPRLSMLVETISEAIDDLWHFFLLLMFVFGGFMLMGIAHFGSERAEFRNMQTAFQFLYEMMLGLFPPGCFDNVIFGVYILAFNFLVFFVMLNFIIAIIVDTYIKVAQVVKENEAESEFLIDAFSLVGMHSKRLYYGWPKLAPALLLLCTIVKRKLVYREIVEIFEQCGCAASGVPSFMLHYSRNHAFMSVADEENDPHEILGSDNHQRRIEQRIITGLTLCVSACVCVCV